MEDEEVKENEGDDSEAEVQPKRKKSMVLGGGVLGLVVAAYIVSMVALPGDSEPPRFDGPFTGNLSEESVQVNIGGKDYLNMSMPAIKFDAYSQDYGAMRLADEVVQRDIIDILQRLGRQKTKALLNTQLGEDVFRQELVEALSPIIFPVHVGNKERSDRPHEASGIAPGRSIELSTMRGGFESHVIHLNTYKGEISLDEGPVVPYGLANQDDELDLSDLMLESANGLVVYVDVSDLEPEFADDIQVGTFGVIKKITFRQFLTQ